ncbi:MAG: hypothetical protein SWK90_20330 [Chloroflexota bacterium]|nr:hypothetical protein [Chloroflexota bacterium]
MSTRAKEKTSSPLSVVGCLAAGFEIVGRNMWLVVLPVLLDLFLWLGPRFSIVPLLHRFVALLTAQPVPDQAMARQVAQAVQLLEQFGEQFNLLSLLSGLPLLNVPSLIAQRTSEMVSPLGEPRVLLVAGVLALLGWVIVLVPIGLVLGTLYLGSLARHVRVMHSSEKQEADRTIEVGSEVVKLARVLLFSTGMLVIGTVFVPLWLLLAGTATMIAPLLGFLVWALSVGLGSYVVLHLLFVVHSVLLGERGILQAAWESIVLIHTQFPSVVGLMVLGLVIYEGLGYVWALPSGDSWSLLVGILGNACIATGLTAATFVFYQERLAVGRQQAVGRD